jgi:phosphatidylglycerophosphate synthase
MAGSAESLTGAGFGPWSVLVAATGAVLAGVAAAWAGQLIGGASAAAALVGFAVGVTAIGWYWPRHAGRHRRTFGAANRVTLLRVVGTSWAAALSMESVFAGLPPPGQLLLVALGAGCLVLDGVDGRLARSRGEASAFGARFDMETDAALLLNLSVAVAAVTPAGWWVLAIGGLRYLYVGVSWVVPALRLPLPVRYVRKVIAVVQGVVLLLALALDLVGGVPDELSVLILAGALAALCWSFGRDVVWQWRHR